MRTVQIKSVKYLTLLCVFIGIGPLLNKKTHAAAGKHRLTVVGHVDDLVVRMAVSVAGNGFSGSARVLPDDVIATAVDGDWGSWARDNGS